MIEVDNNSMCVYILLSYKTQNCRDNHHGKRQISDQEHCQNLPYNC